MRKDLQGIFSPCRNTIDPQKLRKFIMFQWLRTKAQMRLDALHASQAMVEFSLAGQVVFANQRFLELTGYSKNEIEGQHHSIFVTSEYATSHAYSAFWEQLRSGRYHSAAYPRLAKDGSVVWLQGSYNPVHNRFGRLTGIIKVAHDVTQQRLDQQRHLSLLEASISQINDVVLITETDSNTKLGSRIVFVNGTFVSRTGISKVNALGKSPNTLNADPTKRGQWEVIRGCLELGQRVQAESISFIERGQLLWAEIDITPIANDMGTYSHWVAVSRDVTGRKASERQVHDLAFHDPLTGLLNRRSLQTLLKTAVEANGAERPIHKALLFVDLDNFKDLNDTHGHSVGDKLLVEVGNRLSNLIRNFDEVARLGGDEFVLLLSNLSGELSQAVKQATSVGEQVRQQLSGTFTLESLSYNASASIGIVVFSGDGSQSADDVLKHADSAMYQAKHAGRNAVRLFDPAMQSRLMRRAQIEADLKVALGCQDQLGLAYQTIVNAERTVTGVEALLRWKRPVHEAVATSEFVTIAEESGLIVPIGMWVLRTACDQLTAWSSIEKFKKLTIAVNVSALQFRQPAFVREVIDILMTTRADPHLLKIELTESLLLHDVESIIAKMLELRSYGVSFSVDDFGTGYSSLSYLKQLPFSALKLDRSFVRDVLVDSNDAAIARTVLALGKSLGLEVVAEGVESEGQWEFLRENGCMAFQGFLFSKPCPASMVDPTTPGGVASDKITSDAVGRKFDGGNFRLVSNRSSGPLK